MISKKQAKNIVNYFADIVNDEIIVMDSNAIIIHSIEEEKIGQTHKNGEIVANSGTTYVVDDEKNSEIISPIYIGKEIVGIVALRGSLHNIGRFNEFVVRTTKLLIKESMYFERRAITEENKRYLVGQILQATTDRESVMERVLTAGYSDIEKTKHIVVVSKKEFENVKTLTEYKIYDRISAEFTKAELNAVLQKRLVIFSSHEIGWLEKRLQKIVDDLEKQQILDVTIAISKKMDADVPCLSYYHQTVAVNEYYSANGKSGVFKVGDTTFEMMLISVDEKIQQQFCNDVFYNLSLKEGREIRKIVKTLVDNDGRLDKTSAQLFMHVNTLKYKLEKMKKSMGKDPRKYKDLVDLYTATILYEMGDARNT